MHFKVCSCPKRDMNKEMSALPPSKKREAPATSHGKHPSKTMCLHTHHMVKTEPSQPQPTSPPVEMEMTPFNPPSESPPNINIELNFYMPNKESALHVLRCAYNEITGLMAKDKANQNQYIVHERNIEKLIGMQLTN